MGGGAKKLSKKGLVNLLLGVPGGEGFIVHINNGLLSKKKL